MNASLVSAVPGQDRFARFLWISAIAHLLAVALFVGIAKFPRGQDEREVLSFELVGAPPRGPAGPAASPPPAAAPEASEEPVASEEAVPAPMPDPVPTVSVKPPAPAQPARPSAAKLPEAPRTGAASGPSAASALPAGPLAGSPTGDTLSVGGQGGQPTVMNLWLSRVKYLVERNWSAPPGLTGVSAAPEVVFDVARDGRHSRPRLRVKSGNAVLDGLALRSVASVDLFPPVPAGWKADVVTVRYVLEYAH